MVAQTQQIPLTRSALTKAWRAAKLPRLYWRMAHPDWKWDRDDVARWRDGTVCVTYQSMTAIRREIEEVGKG